MRTYNYANELRLFNQSQVSFRETQRPTIWCSHPGPLRNCGKFCFDSKKMTSQGPFQISTVAGTQQAIFYNGNQWG